MYMAFSSAGPVCDLAQAQQFTTKYTALPSAELGFPAQLVCNAACQQVLVLSVLGHSRHISVFALTRRQLLDLCASPFGNCLSM